MYRTITALTLAACLAWPQPGFADDDEVKFKDDGKEYLYEFKARGCEYKHKYEYNTGKEEIEEKGRCHGVVPSRYYRSREVATAYLPPHVAQPAPMARQGQIACNRDLIGGSVGGALGGLVGAQIGKGTGKTVATVGGVLVGALVGGSIGRSMDAADQACVAEVLEYAAPGETVTWRDPDGATYEVRPAGRFEVQNGQQCREYTTKAMIGGKPQRVYGTACRQPDGSWQKAK